MRTFTVAPSAARLTTSLRDIGYDPSSAVADLVDNSIAAGAGRVEVIIESGDNPRILVADDGDGMSAHRINEALRFGSRREYENGDLGRYGLGLKTASLSQCRTITVVSRRRNGHSVAVRQLDLDLIEQFDEWLVVHPGETDGVRRAKELIDEEYSTVVVWENLDRLLPGRRDTGYARRRLDTTAGRIRDHLAMVFHRFLARGGINRLTVSVNGEKVRPWDPFCQSEPATRKLAPQQFELEVGDSTGRVMLQRWILPTRNDFSRLRDFERAGGPLKWNRQQGLYIYRADRLVQWGGWAGLRAIDEHTKLARCALNFGTDLDSAFNINVAKMRVTIPSALKSMLDRPIQEVCLSAQTAYRDSPGVPETGGSDSGPESSGKSANAATTQRIAGSAAGLALLSAAVVAGRSDAFREITTVLAAQAPEVARDLGLDRI